MKRLFKGVGRGVGISALFLGFACAPVPSPQGAEYPIWPYPAFDMLAQGPEEVVGYPDGLNGRWLVTDPYRNQVLLEARDPRYFTGYSPHGQNRGWLDLGMGTRVESLTPSASDEWILVARYYGGREEEGPVTARALLEVDFGPSLIVGSTALSADLECHGLVYDDRKNRVFLLQTTEDGMGSLELIDLYRGRPTKRLPLGPIPFGIGRRGLAFSPDHLELAVLVGGDPGQADFAPRVGSSQDFAPEDETPQLLLLSSETFAGIERIRLPEQFEPRCVLYSQERGELVLLVSQMDRSLVMTVNLNFHTVEQIVEIQGRATDLALWGDTAFVPTDRGLFRVDLALGLWQVITVLNTEQSGELAVSGDGRTAWLRVFEIRGMEQPGLVEIDLRTGTAMEVLP